MANSWSKPRREGISMKIFRLCIALMTGLLLTPQWTILSAEDLQSSALSEIKNPLERLTFGDGLEGTRSNTTNPPVVGNDLNGGFSSPWQSENPIAEPADGIVAPVDESIERVKILGLENNEDFPKGSRRLPNLSTLGLLGAGVIGFGIYECRRKKRVAN